MERERVQRLFQRKVAKESPRLAYARLKSEFTLSSRVQSFANAVLKYSLEDHPDLVLCVCVDAKVPGFLSLPLKFLSSSS